MINDCVVVLGSGESINRLSEEERRLLNSCPSKIAINKYAAFAHLARIYPTHVFFTDDYYESGRLFFRYLVEQLNHSRKENLTFVISKRMSEYLIPNHGNQIINLLKKVFGNAVCSIENRIIFYEKKYPFLKKIYSALFREPKEHLHRYSILPYNAELQIATIVSHLEPGIPWAKSIDEPLYHFKGSLSSVFNYVSIYFPNRKVILVGVDFNSPNYFYEQELSELKFNTRDWTYELRQKEGKHFSVIETDGKRIDDDLPYMFEQLGKTGNTVYSINPRSYLVEKGYIKNIRFDEL